MAINAEPTNEGYTILQGMNKIIELLEGGGGGGALPEVTSDDEGKVLTVVDNDGKYEWEAAAFSCSCAFNVTISEDPDNPGTGMYVLDKTYNEITGAISNGKILQFVFTAPGEYEFLPCMVISGSEGNYAVVLSDPNEDFSHGMMIFHAASADGVLLFNPTT